MKGNSVKSLAVLMGVFLAVTVNLPAYAQPGGSDHPRRFDRPQQQGQQENQQQRPPQEDQGSDRGGQLTQEERQQLRRDIREHGQEVYRERPRRF